MAPDGMELESKREKKKERETCEGLELRKLGKESNG